MEHKRGFTLIELLIVIAIIGILSAIGISSLNGAREKARDAQRVSDLGQMRTALTVYYDDNKAYPSQTLASQPGEVDCVRSDGQFFRVSFVSSGTTLTTAHFSVWQSGSGFIPHYLSRQIAPPAGGSGWQNIYCYDVNRNAAAQNSSYTLFTGLEAAGGTGFFSVNSEGSVGDTKPPAVCDAQAICPV